MIRVHAFCSGFRYHIGLRLVQAATNESEYEKFAKDPARSQVTVRVLTWVPMYR